MSNFEKIVFHQSLKTSFFENSWVAYHIFLKAFYAQSFLPIQSSLSSSQAMVKSSITKKGNIVKSEKGAVEKLLKKAINTLKDRHCEDVELNNPPPHQLQQIIQPMTGRLMEVKRDLEQGNFEMVKFLETLTDTQLDELNTIFKAKSYSEDKIATAASVSLRAEFQLIDTSIEHLQHLRNELMMVFLNSYTSSGYYQLKGNEAVFWHEKFLADVKSIQDYRRGIRRTLEATTEDGDVNSAPSETENGCSIM